MGTIAKFAFVSSFVPGGADEAAIKNLLSRDPTVGELSVLRRLLAKSYSLTAAELRQQVERTAKQLRLTGWTALRNRRPCTQGSALRVLMNRATGS